jgi:hypothetical protein
VLASANLAGAVEGVERQLAALSTALREHDSHGVETEAARLHAALAAAVEHFSRAAREGGVPPVLRHRLALAGGQVAAQREALARATAAMDRAIDVLLPPATGGTAALYGARGLLGHERNAAGGVLTA